MNFKQQLKYSFQNLNAAEKLIVINVVFFVFPLFLNSILFLFNVPVSSFLSWIELSSDWRIFLFRPWTFLTYSLIHSGFFHLFWNMVLLFFSGRFFLNLLSEKRFVSVYLSGVLFGGVVFVLSYLIFPAFQGATPSLVGASAGVMAVFIFVCTYFPDAKVSVLLFNVKLRHLGTAFVLMDILQIPSGNAGGHLAHIGGAAFGFYCALQLKKGKDIGVPLENIFEMFSNLFERRKAMKTVYKSRKTNVSKGMTNTDSRQKKIDEILDKISTSGYDCLSQEEKDFLFDAGKD